MTTCVSFHAHLLLVNRITSIASLVGLFVFLVLFPYIFSDLGSLCGTLLGEPMGSSTWEACGEQYLGSLWGAVLKKPGNSIWS